MHKIAGLFMCLFVSVFALSGQVKPEYLYNEAMPYGTLDIRTQISASNYYLLKEGVTFSYRETAPGVKSDTYRDMTDWDSSPFDQGYMIHKKGAAENFVMNYRILKPLNYDENFDEGYPMILMMHGGFERANCHFENCHHADWNYDPLINSPAAPVTTDHELLNNDHNINLGGRQHIDARNWAGHRLPNAPDLNERAFPGFVIIPQMMNDWDSLSVENAIRIALLHTKKYNINMNRVYVHGLSIGGHAVYQVIKRAPWLFAAALPISAVKNGYIFKHGQQEKLINIPLWLFQGGEDPNPTVGTTIALADQFRDAGATVRYTEYADLGHAVWNRAFDEDDFFAFMLSKNKANVYPVKGNAAIVKKENIYPTLMLAEGFFDYQWELDGELLESNSNIYVAKEPGSYRARFSRIINPSEAEWNRWSEVILVTEEEEVITGIETPSTSWINIFPNPSSSDNLQLGIEKHSVVELTIVDAMGRLVHREVSTPVNSSTRKLKTGSTLSDGIYMVIIKENGSFHNRRIVIRN